MTEFQYGVKKNASGLNALDYVGMYIIDHLRKSDVPKGEDHLSYPITINFVYGNCRKKTVPGQTRRSVTETIIILDRKISYEGYRGIELDGNESFKSEGNYANKLRVHLEELLTNSKLSKDIKMEIEETFKKENAEVPSI